MFPILLAAVVGILPYAPSSLIFQSESAVKAACAQFSDSANADLNQFIKLSQNNEYTAAYQVWSDLLFRYFSSRLEMGKTIELSSSDSVKAAVRSEGESLEAAFQRQLLDYPGLLGAFLHNAEAAAQLTGQQRLFTANILKEYQAMNLKQRPKIAEALQKLSIEKTEAFCRELGSAKPVDGNTLSKLKVLTANIICFPGKLPYMYGGISPWEERIDRLIETIRSADAQIVCLQEVWDPKAMRALADRLRNDYAVFIYGAGDPAGTLEIKKMGYSSGLFIASKLPLDAVTFSKFHRSIPEGSNRGALLITTLVAQRQFACLNTHLQHGNTPLMREVRQEQLSSCSEALQTSFAKALGGSAWGCLVGDLNIDAFLPEFHDSGLARLFSVPYVVNLSNAKATCTEYFNDLVLTPIDERSKVPLSYELLDYCVLPATSSVTVHGEQTLIPLYDLAQPSKALSDHQALLTTWVLPQAPGLQLKQENQARDSVEN